MPPPGIVKKHRRARRPLPRRASRVALRAGDGCTGRGAYARWGTHGALETGDASTPLTPITLRAVHPERPRNDTLLTSLSSSVFTNVLATVNAGGGTTSATASVVVNPGFVEYYVDAGPTTTPGTYTLEVGLIVEYA